MDGMGTVNIDELRQQQNLWVETVLGVRVPSATVPGQSALSAGEGDAATPHEPFQIFVKSVDDITLTLRLPNGSATPLGELRGMVEGRTGLSLDEHSLMIGSKPFRAAHAGLAVAEYGVQPNQTLFLQGALKGGFGERTAVADVIVRGIRAGNVVSDIVETKGESRAKAAFCRYMLQEDKRKGMEKEAALFKNFKAALFKKLDKGGLLPNGVASEAKLETWMKDNMTFVSAIACSRLQAGTCADYANVVYTSLISNTKNQTVYRAGMTGGYDHAFVITSPTDHGDDFEALSNDPDAMVVDAWDKNKICSFKEFADGNNPYEAKLDPTQDLVLRRHDTATGKPPLSKEFESAMNNVIDEFVKVGPNQEWLAARTKKFKQNADEIAAAENEVDECQRLVAGTEQKVKDYLFTRDWLKEQTARQELAAAEGELAAAQEALKAAKGGLLFGSAGDPWDRDTPRDHRTDDERLGAFDQAFEKGGVKQLAAEMEPLSDEEFLSVCKLLAKDKPKFKKYLLGVDSKFLQRCNKLLAAEKAQAQQQQAQQP